MGAIGAILLGVLLPRYIISGLEIPEAVQEIGVKANVWWQAWHAQVCFTSNDHTKHRQAASSSHAKFKLDCNPAWRPG